MHNMKVGDTLRAWMEAANDMSENELSRRSRVPQPTIHRILTGESADPRRSNLEKLAKVFGKTAQDMYLDAELGGRVPDFTFEATGTVTPPEALELFRELSEEEQDALLVLMRSMLSK